MCGAFTVDLSMPRERWFRWKSGIIAPFGCDCRQVNAFPAVRRLIDGALTDAVRQAFPDAGYVVGIAQSGIPWAKTLAERLDLPLAYVRTQSRAPGGPLVECAPRGTALAIVTDRRRRRRPAQPVLPGSPQPGLAGLNPGQPAATTASAVCRTADRVLGLDPAGVHGERLGGIRRRERRVRHQGPVERQPGRHPGHLKLPKCPPRPLQRLHAGRPGHDQLGQQRPELRSDDRALLDPGVKPHTGAGRWTPCRHHALSRREAVIRVLSVDPELDGVPLNGRVSVAKYLAFRQAEHLPDQIDAGAWPNAAAAPRTAAA
jgi:hypothetical protein